jgi:hypothetical protein
MVQHELCYFSIHIFISSPFHADLYCVYMCIDPNRQYVSNCNGDSEIQLMVIYSSMFFKKHFLRAMS